MIEVATEGEVRYPYRPEIETVDAPRSEAEEAEAERIGRKFQLKPMPKQRSSGSEPQKKAEQAYLDSVAGAADSSLL